MFVKPAVSAVALSVQEPPDIHRGKLSGDTFQFFFLITT